MLLTAVALLDTAHARDELNLASDRPGIGDSTSTPGRGRFIVQLGVAGSFAEGQSGAVSTSGWSLRAGADQGVELRLREGIAALAGGGASWTAGAVSAYANAWHVFGGATFVGGGGWWLVTDTVQLDAGLDVGVGAGPAQLVPGAGVSLGF